MKFSDCNDGCDLPNSWACLELGLLGEWSGGGTPSKGNAAFWTNGSIPWISPKDMKCLEIHDTEDYITAEAVGNSATKLIPENSLIMVTRSGILRHTFPVAINKVQAALNQDLKALTPANGISSKFVAYYLILSNDRVLASCAKDGTTVQSVETDRLRKFEVPIAPEAEQARIVSKIEELFSDLEKGEESLRQAQAQLKRYRQSVLKAAVTGELTRDWREQNKDRLETGEALLERILKARREAWEKAELEKMRAKGVKPKDDSWKKKYVEPKGPDTTGLPELPDGWVWATFGQLGEFGRGKSKHRPRNDPKLFGGKYPFLQTGKVRASNGRIKTFDSHYSEFGLAQSKLWPAGTICITIAANIAESGILSFDACFPDSVVGLVPDKEVVGEYIEFFVRTARNELDAYAPATAQKNINLEILESVAIPIPSTEEQREIYSKAWEILSVVDVIESDLLSHFSSSYRLRQSILKSAFSGTLVPQDPNDEPASMLLKRIAAEKAASATPPPVRRAGPRQKKRDTAASVKQAELPTALPQKQTASGLAQLRKDAGMSQAELAKAIGLNQAYISQMETGKRTMTADQAREIATVLNAEPSDL